MLNEFNSPRFFGVMNRMGALVLFVASSCLCSRSCMFSLCVLLKTLWWSIFFLCDCCINLVLFDCERLQFSINCLILNRYVWSINLLLILFLCFYRSSMGLDGDLNSFVLKRWDWDYVRVSWDWGRFPRDQETRFPIAEVKRSNVLLQRNCFFLINYKSIILILIAVEFIISIYYFSFFT